jgi:succinyl-diaminopimelate desuccinylase
VDYHERVFSHILSERVVELASELIKIPCVNPPGDEEELARWAEDFMKDLGMEVIIQPVAPRRANAIGRLCGHGDEEGLIFSGHLDVVPVSQEEESVWESQPFQPAVKEAKLFGRGAADAKGGAAAILCAVEDIQKAGIRLAGDVWVALSADEEGVMSGVKTLVNSGTLRGATGVVVAEPSENRLCLSSKGQTWGWVHIYGKTAHTSLQGAGVNAIHAATRFIDRLLNRRPNHQAHPLLGESWWAVTMIHGGVGESIVPDSCGLNIDGRLVPGQSVKQRLMIHSPHVSKSLGKARHGRLHQRSTWLRLCGGRSKSPLTRSLN